MLTAKVTEITHLSAHQKTLVVTCSGHVPKTDVPSQPKTKL